MLAAASSPERVEAPVTVKAYLLCVFASFGGIFFGCGYNQTQVDVC
jgi:hypothetical protein